MSEDQNQHSEEGSFKEQIMRALEEGRKNREADATKKTHTRPESSKVKKMQTTMTIWLRPMSVYLVIDEIRRIQLPLSRSLNHLKRK